MKKHDVPNPGSNAAFVLGCTCPVVDNQYGRGYMGQRNVFVYQRDCPIHTPAKMLGRKGGMARSRKKAKACRDNAKKRWATCR